MYDVPWCISCFFTRTTQFEPLTLAYLFTSCAVERTSGQFLGAAFYRANNPSIHCGFTSILKWNNSAKAQGRKAKQGEGSLARASGPEPFTAKAGPKTTKRPNRSPQVDPKCRSPSSWKDAVESFDGSPLP